jgi:hypothetical protein
MMYKTGTGTMCPAARKHRYRCPRIQKERTQQRDKSEDGVLSSAMTKLETTAHLLPKKMVTLYTAFHIAWLIATFIVPTIIVPRTKNQEAYHESLTISVCHEK